jgi:MFS family permease
MENTEEKKIVISKAFAIAWVISLAFYFLEYAVRSCPAVMITQLAEHFKTTPVGVGAVLGSYYYTYAITSLIAGIALDHFGGKYPVAIGLLMLAAGCVLFTLPSAGGGYAGRMLQGAGSAFGFTGCVYLATHGFSSRFTATAIGITQCIGMFGGSAGQFIVGHLIKQGMGASSFWMLIGATCAVVCGVLFIATPREDKSTEGNATFHSMLHPFQIVFSNSQSYLSGIISGLLFAPTTIFVMTWGVAFFQKDRGLDYDTAVLTCSMTPLGWVIGCPLVGWISDRINRRKSVLIVSIIIMLISFAQMIYFAHLLPLQMSMLLFGIASGAAMIPYSMIKEANPPEVKGSATGTMNFLTFSITAIIGPLFGRYLGKTLATANDPAAHFELMGMVIIGMLILALIVSLIIRETAHSADESSTIHKIRRA